MLVYVNEVLTSFLSKINCNGQLHLLAASYWNVYCVSFTGAGFLPFPHLAAGTLSLITGIFDLNIELLEINPILPLSAE